MKKRVKTTFFEKIEKIIFPLGLFPTILFYIQNAERMKTELLHKYFRGETTEKRKAKLWNGRKAVPRTRNAFERTNVV